MNTFWRGTKEYTRFYEGEDDPKGLALTEVKDPKTGRSTYKTADGKTFFTQDHMNTEIGNARKKAAEQNKTTLTELQALRDKAGNTEETNATLQHRIDELQSLQLTDQQQYELKLKKAETKYTETTDTLTQERNTWQQRYETERISSAIAVAADKHKAVSAEQMSALLSGKTKLAPVMGEDGKATGEFVTQVAFEDVDKDKNPVTLTLTVDKAMERMRELPERFGNLFKHDQKGGLDGGTLQKKSGYNGEGPPKTQAEYEVFRKANAGKLGFREEELGVL